jgi:hypothetical protein
VPNSSGRRGHERLEHRGEQNHQVGGDADHSSCAFPSNKGR